jgi:hypothetical protein
MNKRNFAKELLLAVRAVRRTRSNEPDDEYVVEHNGEKWYAFAASFKDGDSTFVITFYARDKDEASRLIGAMKETLTLDGQLMSSIPNE